MAKLHASLCLQAPGTGGRATWLLLCTCVVENCDLLGQQALAKGQGQQSKTFVQIFWVQSSTFAG